jgi:cell wall-associated NlpC family hydrolase
MRRLIIILSAAVSASLLVSFAALAASAQTDTTDQYATEDPLPQESTTQEPISETPEVTETESPVSQGSIAEGPGLPEENFPAYTQVVDDATPERFSAPGWKAESSNPTGYREGYRVASPGDETQPAQFKVEIPATDVYSVYAWWPAEAGNDAATRFGVSTTSGVQWTEVDQQRDGGFWVKLGEYEMQAGDGVAVQVSPGSGGEGLAVADAVAVVRGVLTPPPDEAASGGAEGDRITTAGGGPNGRDVVRTARRHIGTNYVRSPPGTCRSMRKEDCSCHTKVVFRKFDRRLPEDPVKQWKYGRKVARSNLRPGDLVFFKEGGSNAITHVGIYSGNGDLVHASSYWGKVVEKPMKYIDGYFGAKRLKPR